MGTDHTLYCRITEAIDAGIAQALSRRKGEGISVSGNGRKEMSVPEDPSTYGKHTKDWFLVSDMVRRGLPVTSSGIREMTPEDIALAERYLDGGFDRETMEFCNANGFYGLTAKMSLCRIFDWIGTLDDRDMSRLADRFCNFIKAVAPNRTLSGFYEPDTLRHAGRMLEMIVPKCGLRWIDMLSREGRSGMTAGIVDGEGRLLSFNDFLDGMSRKVPMIFLTTPGLTETGREIRICPETGIPQMPWKKAMGHAASLRKEIGGKEYAGELPDREQMQAIYVFRHVIDYIFRGLGLGEFSMDGAGNCWTSETDGNGTPLIGFSGICIVDTLTNGKGDNQTLVIFKPTAE